MIQRYEYEQQRNAFLGGTWRRVKVGIALAGGVIVLVGSAVNIIGPLVR